MTVRSQSVGWLLLRFITRTLLLVAAFFVIVCFPYIVIFQVIPIDSILFGFFIFQFILYLFFIEYVAEELVVQVVDFSSRIC